MLTAQVAPCMLQLYSANGICQDPKCRLQLQAGSHCGYATEPQLYGSKESRLESDNETQLIFTLPGAAPLESEAFQHFVACIKSLPPRLKVFMVNACAAKMLHCKTANGISHSNSMHCSSG